MTPQEAEYRLVASSLAFGVRHVTDADARRLITESICDWLEETYRLFDERRFMQACRDTHRLEVAS
jgi:hypothetical protein